jgi:SAM-dependent methyltransferase
MPATRTLGTWARFHAAFISPSLSSLADARGLREQRRRILREASGRTLELHGFGTGRNLGLYPAAVTELVLLEGPHHVDAKLPRVLSAHGGSARLVEAPGASLPFGDRSFDAVVTTLALCFVPDLAAMIAEIARVLRPEGRFLFLEHVRSPSPRLARWQDRLATLWRAVAVGCHCERDTLASIVASPLAIDWVERGQLRGFPPLVRPLVMGAATASS